MSELTLEHFDETMRAIAETLGDHGNTLEEHTQRFDRMDAHLDALEQLLSVSARLDKIEVLLAEKFGRDVLIQAGL